MNMPLTDPLELSISLYKTLQGMTINGRSVEGVVATETDFEDLILKLDNAKLLTSHDQGRRYVEISLPSNFFLTFDNLISTSERRICPPERFYVAEMDSLYNAQSVNETAPPNIANYLAAASLFHVLGKAADHIGGIGNTKVLIFLNKSKLEIIPDYQVSDLCELKGLKQFTDEFIDSETHKDQKTVIIRTVLLELFSNKAKVKFSELLNNFDSFMEKLVASYQLYVSEFSFQKVKAEIEKEKLDATVKLNKVFSDIQNQLLSVPAALILVGGQMKDAGDWTSNNLTIWIGAIVFAVLMTLLVRNQRHTLDAVKQEIDQQWLQIKNKHHAVAERFQYVYQQLDKRHRHQRSLIGVVSTLVAVSVVVSTGMLLIFSVSFELACQAAFVALVSAAILVVIKVVVNFKACFIFIKQLFTAK